MRFNVTTASFLCVFLSALLPGAVYAHSHLADPLPTRQLHCRVGGDARECHGPCPVPDDYGRLNPVNKNQPAEVWGRGATVNVRWHRDNRKYFVLVSNVACVGMVDSWLANHGSLHVLLFVIHVFVDDGTGFVRLTLVPIEKMMDKKAHDQFAFQFLCMNEGPHRCRDRSYDTCGNDFEGMAWQARVRVPTSYPDGTYVFGWSWYGGGNYLDRSFFGDYYSCSYIEIRGGLEVSEDYQPVFDGTTCRSATDALGKCWREPCHYGPVRDMVPIEFNGRRPAAIRRDWLPEADARGSETFAPLEVGASGGRGVGFASGPGASVSLGARSGGGEGRADAGGGSGSGGSLGVFFLDFHDFTKKAIADGGRYRRAAFRRGFTVEAFYNGAVRFIEFFVDGRKVRQESVAPFVMNGNKGSLIHGWDVPVGRVVRLEVFLRARNGHQESFKASFQFD